MSITRVILLVALLTACLRAAQPAPSDSAHENRTTEERTSKESAAGYSGEQTVDQPAAPTAKGTDWFAEAKFGLFIVWGLYAVTEPSPLPVRPGQQLSVNPK